MKEKFTAKVYKLGSGSSVLTVPAFLVNEKRVEPGKEYTVIISDEQEE